MRRGSWWAWVAFSALWVALVAWICSMRIDAELATTTVMPWEVAAKRSPPVGLVVVRERSVRGAPL